MEVRYKKGAFVKRIFPKIIIVGSYYFDYIKDWGIAIAAILLGCVSYDDDECSYKNDTRAYSIIIILTTYIREKSCLFLYSSCLCAVPFPSVPTRRKM